MKIIDKKIVKKIYDKFIQDDVPCYVYNFDQIKKNISNIANYMPSNFFLYYAIKANPNADVLKYIKSFKEVSGFEIASIGELETSLKYCNNKEIIFTGPAKTPKELKEAIKHNINLINVESIIEAIRINKIAEEENVDKVDILLRINMDYKIEDAAENMGGLSTKMGIDECQLFDSLSIIKNLKHLNIKGIHVFSASGILHYQAAIDYAKYVFKIVDKLEKYGQNIEIIDLGGGFGVDYSGNEEIFDTKKYFYELKKLIDKANYGKKKFILELGCYLVANSGYYLSKIVDIKSSKGYKHIVLAGGLNHIPTFTLNGKHPFYILQMNEKKLYDSQIDVNSEVVDIDGPLCTAEDKVLWDVFVEKASIGDVVVIRQAGAYCYCAAWLEFLSHEKPYEIIYDNNKIYISGDEYEVK